MQKASKSQRNQLTRQNKGLSQKKVIKLEKATSAAFGCPLACPDTVQRRQKEGKEGKRRKKKHKKAKGNCHFPDELVHRISCFV